MPVQSLKVNKSIFGDCMKIMPTLPDGAFDLILADLPYTKTSLEWDKALPLAALWKEYERLIKPNGAIVLFSCEPFASLLRCSNLRSYKYDLIWDKCNTTNWTNAKRMPLRRHENILVFYKKQPTYNPQFEEIRAADYRYRKNGRGHNAKTYKNTAYGTVTELKREETGKRYPNTILKFSNSNWNGKLHPTQKPVLLYEFLIKSFTNEGELVLDNVAGSGTLGVACLNTNRNYVMIENNMDHFETIKIRIKEVTKEIIKKKKH